MKIAFNISPLKNAHKLRGIGFYTDNLLNYLKQDESLVIQEFSDIREVKDADVIHYPWFDLFFRTLPFQKKIPTVVTIHDVMPLLFPKHFPVGLKGKINLFLQKKSLRNCKYIITDSETSKKDIIRYLKVEDKKIAVIPLASGPEFKMLKNETELLHAKRKYHLPDRFLIYVGDANWVKNLPFLIEGFKHIVQSPQFTDVKLVLVGGAFLKSVENIDHPELESLKLVNRLIKAYKLEEHIIRPGQISTSELVEFYNLATIYIQPSIYEGFGLPVLQAFSCGVPVVSSKGGSLQEIGGQAAVYFDPDNLKQFIVIVKELLENTSLRKKLSQLGILQSAKFSWNKVADETKQTYLKAEKNE